MSNIVLFRRRGLPSIEKKPLELSPLKRSQDLQLTGNFRYRKERISALRTIIQLFSDMQD